MIIKVWDNHASLFTTQKRQSYFANIRCCGQHCIMTDKQYQVQHTVYAVDTIYNCIIYKKCIAAYQDDSSQNLAF